MSFSIDFKSRKTVIIIASIAIIAVIAGLGYITEVKKEELNQHKITPPPSAEEIARISEDVWNSYKAEQAENEKLGVPVEAENKPDQVAEVKDYFLETLRETLPVGSPKEKVIELISLDDACLVLNQDASSNTLIVYECVISQRYPRGSVRRAVLDNNGNLVDYFIDDNAGIHTGKPFVSPSLDAPQ